MKRGILRLLVGRRAVALFMIAVAASFATWIGAKIVGPPDDAKESAGNDSFSRSALGHRAFVELMSELGHTVILSQRESAARAADSALLVVLEPDLEVAASGTTLDEIKKRRGPSLVVLPKRRGIPASERPGWVSRVEPRGTSAAKNTLERLGVGAIDVTSARPAGFFSRRGFPSHLEVDDAQLVTSSRLDPIVADDANRANVLVAEISHGGRGRIILISDPDVIANHGLGRGENATLVARVVEDLVGGDGVLLIDETSHGFETTNDVFGALLRRPLWPLTASGLVVCLLLFWRAFPAFGARRRSGPAIEPGKAILIENTANLLSRGRGASDALARYVETTLQSVARRFGAADGAPIEEVKRVLELRSSRLPFDPVATVEALRTNRSRSSVKSSSLALARKAWSFQREIVNGTERTARVRRPTAGAGGSGRGGAR